MIFLTNEKPLNISGFFVADLIGSEKESSFTADYL